MSLPALIPATFQGDTRRRIPKVSQNKRVPLWTVEPEGQEFQGVIRVPVSLCHTIEHTNARHAFDKLIRANLERWVEWRKRRGWFISEKPRVSGPFDPPEGDRSRAAVFQDRVETKIGRSRDAGAITEFDYAEEYKWYVAEARFTREEPVYVRLEDMLFMRHLALTYGVDPDRDPATSTPLPEAKDELAFEGGLNPLEVAEERRQSMGLKRSDYLIGKLEDPL